MILENVWIKRYSLALCLGLAACNAEPIVDGYRFIKVKSVVYNSLEVDDRDNRVSLDEFIIELGRYDNNDRVSEAISTTYMSDISKMRDMLQYLGGSFQNAFIGHSDDISVDHEVIAERTKAFVAAFNSYNHPFARLLSKELQELSYVSIDEYEHASSKLPIDRVMRHYPFSGKAVPEDGAK